MIKFPGKRALVACVNDYLRVRANCLFVLSTGRVGTTTLTHLLSLNPRVYATHEPEPLFLEETKDAYQRPRLSTPVANHFVTVFLSCRRGRMIVSHWQNKLYAECSNRLTYVAPVLANNFPRAKFVFLYRHPGEVVRSGMRRNYYRGHLCDPYRITPLENDPYYSQWPHWDAFRKTCWYWRAVNSWSRDIANDLGSERVFRLSFEELIGDTEQVGRRLFEWLGMECPAPSSIQEIVQAKYNAQDSGNFPRYEEWTDEQKATMATIVEPLASQLGYRL